MDVWVSCTNPGGDAMNLPSDLAAVDDDDDDEVVQLKQRCATLRNAIDQPFPPSKISVSSKLTLLRLVDAEHRFLSRFPPHRHRRGSISSNLGYLESLARIVLHPSVASVTRLSRPLPAAPVPVHLDLVCNVRRSPAWLLVSDRNPNHISWLPSRGDKGLRQRIELVVCAARSALALKPESVILVFSHGIGDDIVGKLDGEFGAVEIDFFEELEDGWIDVLMLWRKDRVFEIKIGVDCGDGLRHLGDLEDGGEVCSGDEFGSLISSMRLGGVDSAEAVNFDTTALVAIVSGISNGSAERLLNAPKDEMRRRFKSNYEFVVAQVTSEVQLPILAELRDAIAGKKGIICESVCSEFKELISMCGGPNEKLRAEQLIKRLLIVPDCPSTPNNGFADNQKDSYEEQGCFWYWGLLACSNSHCKHGIC
ncbi:hypothetical protein J5N97_022891 [Dioscorea zingiberensis]|uniref:DUF1308 domain-containing protein n=1 Tax=Dioscorea zingiberensis TaxID=325984 RepID=A0A9D5CBR4_9LILI|nr:hypothetical protein J5N97_022891 [Dioscorea zingiberensis]